MHKEAHITNTVHMLKLSEVATFLRVDYQLVRSLVLAGQLRGIKVGGTWRIRQVDLDNYLEKKSTSQSRN